MLMRVAEALTVGACGGFVFNWFGLPAGYLSGSMLAVGILALAGRPLSLANLKLAMEMVLR